jgi:hypothetical protein
MPNARKKKAAKNEDFKVKKKEAKTTTIKTNIKKSTFIINRKRSSRLERKRQ